MKIKTYKYPSFVGLYQICKALPINEKKSFVIAENIDRAFPFINNFFNWIYVKRIKKDKIEIEEFDTWNADITLAKVIVPILSKLEKIKHGAPIVDNEDVPENLRSEEPTDGKASVTHFEKWDWVMNEMIFGFQFILDSEEAEFDEIYERSSARAKNGRILFAKYFQALWD